MDLRFTPEENAFRAEVRAFMQESVPPATRKKMIEGGRLTKDDLVTWQRILNAKGWAVPHWPKEWGGTDWGPVKTYLFREEMLQTPAPEPLAFGVNMLGPVLVAFGNEAQKKHFLPRIANLDDWWAQGFSEPHHHVEFANADGAARSGTQAARDCLPGLGDNGIDGALRDGVACYLLVGENSFELADQIGRADDLFADGAQELHGAGVDHGNVHDVVQGRVLHSHALEAGEHDLKAGVEFLPA